MPNLPTGTVTFLFTDIEGSTRLWERDRDAMAQALDRHDGLLRDAVAAGGGHVFKTVGDAVCAAFAGAPAALGTAIAAQVALIGEPWGALGPLRVRMAVHTGTVAPHGGDYFGPPLNRVARLLAAGAGGQVLVSQATHNLVGPDLPDGASLRDLGKHRLRDLSEPERIFQLVAPGLDDGFPPLKSLERHPTNLPVPPNPFVGRTQDLAAVKELLGRNEVRLVTLSGMGGTGKTRLGLQVAAELLETFDDGAFFVDLSALADPGLVLPTVTTTLGVREAGGRSLRDALVAYLAEKRLLLVLDNFEQVVAAAPVVADLLGACLGIKVLVTSRARLGLQAEHEYVVPPLPTPDPAHLPPLAALAAIGAVALFVQRATAARHDFALTETNAGPVAAICARLDGLPLAIELAAARVKLLPPRAILERLGSRLHLLTGGARDLPARQQTLRATIEWSHGLLAAEEQALFRRLAIFAGGFTLEAAEAVVYAEGNLSVDVLDGVAVLVDQSLLRQSDGAGSEARFTMLETLREFGLERLHDVREEEATRRAHAEWCLALAESAQPHLMGPEQGPWLERLETEHDNLRAALAATDDGGERSLRIAAALWRFWDIRGHVSEGRVWLRQVLAAGAAPPTVTRANALNGSGVLAFLQTDYDQATAFYTESLAVRRKLDDQQGVAASLNNLGLVAEEQGDYARAISLYEESLALRRALGDQAGVAASLNNLGLVVDAQREYARAQALYEESLALQRELGNQRGIAVSLSNLGLVAYERGDVARAVTLQKECLEILHVLGDKNGFIASLEGIAALAASMARADRAARLFGAAAALRETLGVPVTPVERARSERALVEARAHLGQPTLAKLLGSGRALSVEDAVAEALATLHEMSHTLGSA